MIFVALTVNEVKRARNSMRKTATQGRVVRAEASIVNYYGDVVGKAIDVVFTITNGTRITFSEQVNDTYTAGQGVTVHYNPKNPRETATVLAPRYALGRVIGYTSLTLVTFALFALSQFTGG